MEGRGEGARAGKGVLNRLIPPVAPFSPYLLLRPLLRVGRWVLLLALAAALFVGYPPASQLPHLDTPGVRLALAVALVGYALLSMALLRAPSLTAARIVAVLAADLVFIALLVESTGGMQSIFFGFYYLVVVASALFYELAGGLVAAVIVIGITALGEGLGFHGAVPPPPEAVVTTLPYLLLAAIVSGHLTAQLKREMQRHQEAERAALRLELQRQSTEREMVLAREVQQAALPELPAQVGELQIAVRFRAAAEVGGDFYDFYQRGDDLGLLVGDAGGKGVPAALVATTAMHFFHTQAPNMTLEQWCQQFSQELTERAPAAMLASAVCCRLDPRSGRGGWVNAGHPPPILYQEGTGATLLENYSLLLGVSGDATYTLNELTLEPGNVLVLYTDGVTEAARADGSLTGIEPMLDRLPALTPMPALEIAAALEAHLHEIATPRDDLTLVVIKRQVQRV